MMPLLLETEQVTKLFPLTREIGDIVRGGPRRRWAPRSRFSRTVIRAKQWRPSGARAIPRTTISCAGTRVMSFPSNRIRPDVVSWSRAMSHPSVVFPEPLSPIRPSVSPGAI